PGRRRDSPGRHRSRPPPRSARMDGHERRRPAMTRHAHDAAGRIAFIGGGNMARSLIGGMVARGVEPARISVAEPVEALREALARDFGVAVHADAADAVEGAGTWVFAVKPQVMRAVC